MFPGPPASTSPSLNAAAVRASFADVLITDELRKRPARPPEHAAENRVLRVLARQMAGRPDELLRAIAKAALELCRAGSAGVSLLEKNPEGEELFRWVAIAGAYEPHVGSAVPAHVSPAAVCLATNAPQLFSRPVRRFMPFRDIQPHVIEALAVPLPAESRPAGTIWVGAHDEARKFDSEDARLLTSLADFTAAGLEHFRITDVLLKRNERLRLLWEAAAALLSTDDPNAMLRRVVSKIASHIGIDACLNYMVDESGDGLRLATAVGLPEDVLQGIARLRFGEAVSGLVARERTARMASHVSDSDDPRFEGAKSFGARAYACFPLLAEERLLGTLAFASRAKDEFDHDELDFLRTICDYLTVAYDRLRLLKELKDSDRRKDEFLATLAHELRNPLAPLRNAAQLLRLGGHDPAVVKQARATMERQLATMVRLIDDLLDVSRITYGCIGLKKQRIDLANVLASAIESSRPLIEAAGHDFRISLPREPIILEADMTRLAQVFMNLLNNAAKYTEPGGRIELKAERHSAEAWVGVKDSGIGIAREALPRVFDMFMQADHSLERAGGGLGIGLTLVKRLVEMHGGTVEAASAGPLKGSEFIVRLPIAAAANAEPDSGQGTDARKGTSPRRVLVVDDNVDAVESLAMLLQMMGNEVRSAQDGLEAVNIAASFRPEVVLMDIGMPKMNGYDAARHIRGEPWGKDILLVALTGWGQTEEQRRSKEAGFDLHLVKPVQPAALQELLAWRR